MKTLICILLALIPLSLKAEQRVFRVYFENDKFNLDSRDSSVIDSINTFTKTNHIQSIIILGYCDDNGAELDNDKLSQNRAQVIYDMMDDKSLVTVKSGRGSILIEPQSSVPPDTQRFYNRCTEVTINYDGERIPTDLGTSEVKTELTSDMEVGEKLTLSRLQFEGGRHILLPSSEPILEELLTQLQTYPKYEIEIQGHICCVGEVDGLDLDLGTHDLSVQRAKMIYEYLVQNGIDSSRLRYKGFGSKYRTGPSVPQDRRVEILITNIR